MRKIERTGQFKRDYKRELKGRHRATLEITFVDAQERGQVLNCESPALFIILLTEELCKSKNAAISFMLYPPDRYAATLASLRQSIIFA